MLQQSEHPSGRRASTARDSQRCLYGALGTSAVSTLLRCLLGRMIETRVRAGAAQAPRLPHFIPFLCRGFNNFVVPPYFLTRGPFPSRYRKSVGPLGSTRNAVGRVPRLGRFRPQFLTAHDFGYYYVDLLDSMQRPLTSATRAVGCNSTPSQHNTIVCALIIIV